MFFAKYTTHKQVNYFTANVNIPPRTGACYGHGRDRGLDEQKTRIVGLRKDSTHTVEIFCQL